MRTTAKRRQERTCELCGQYYPGDTVRSREIPQGDFMVKRRVCPNCARAANELGHAYASQDSPAAALKRANAHKTAEKQAAREKLERRRAQYRASKQRQREE